MVEFALALPLLLVVLTGVFSFGIIMNQYQILTNATNDGARAFAFSEGLSQPPLAASDPCAYAALVTEQAAPSLVAANITFSVSYTPPGGSTTTYSAVTSSSGCPGVQLTKSDVNGTVTVQTSYPVVPAVFGWATKSLTISASSSEQIQ